LSFLSENEWMRNNSKNFFEEGRMQIFSAILKFSFLLLFCCEIITVMTIIWSWVEMEWNVITIKIANFKFHRKMSLRMTWCDRVEDGRWRIFEKICWTELILDLTELILDLNELILDLTELILDLTEPILDLTELILTWMCPKNNLPYPKFNWTYPWFDWTYP